MDRKTLKRIYKLRYEVHDSNEIKLALAERYDIYISRAKIEGIVSKMPLPKKYTPFLERLMLRMYRDFYDTDKAISYLNKKYNIQLTKSALYSRASKKKVKKKEYRNYDKSFISRKDEDEIVRLYKLGKTSEEIAEIYGYKTKVSIIQKLNRNNVQIRDSGEIMKGRRKYKDFNFINIDSQEKAYIIGLLISDGYVSESRSYIGIDLVDKDCIEFISDFININYTTIPSKNKKHKTKYRILIYGKEYLEQVERFGIFPNKTFKTKGCELNKNEQKYIPYILRGVIDGDGWIRKDGKEFFISSASEAFIYWCKNSLEDIGFINIKYSFKKNESNGIYIIRTALKSNIDLLKKEIYDAPLGMSRKYDRLYKKNVQRL